MLGDSRAPLVEMPLIELTDRQSDPEHFVRACEALVQLFRQHCQPGVDPVVAVAHVIRANGWACSGQIITVNPRATLEGEG